ncbi:MAG: glycosyltransferase [Geminicoccaceae bacterium]|nr:glycosyltransferase [Geminicoccaceae bacterium]
MNVEFVLWVLAAGIALVGLWPFGPYQLTLLAARTLFGPVPVRTARETEGASRETFAICVCAHNEEAVIEQKIRNMLDIRDAAGEGVEILLYCDGCTDRTVEIARRFEPDVKVIASEERRGKFHGLNSLAQAARATILIFTDANVRVDRNLVPVLRQYFADPRIGCVDVPLRHANPDATPTAEVGTTYWRFEEWTKRLETDTGSIIGADGSCYAIRKRLFRTLGPGVCDDFHVSMSALVQGARVVSAREVVAEEVYATRAEDEFRRRLRIAAQVVHSHSALWPEISRLDLWHRYKYLSHRVARWASGACLLGAVVFAAGAAGVRFGALSIATGVAAFTALFATALLLGNKIVLRLWNAIVSFGGTTMGLCHGLLGRRQAIWDPVPSSRVPIPGD